MASNTPTDLAWEFRKFAQLNQRVEKPVLHISLSPAPDDRILDEWELCMIAQDLLEGLELTNNQFILVQHNDAEYDGKVRPHIHLVINRVSVNGKCNDDYLDYYRTEKLLRQIEKEYNLIPQLSSWEVEKKKAYPKHVEKAAGGSNIVERLQNAIALAASDKPEMPVFVARLLKDKIQVNCKFTRTGKLKGISYCLEGEAFKGGDLGKLYTHIGIRKHLGIGYQQHYSDAISSLMESYKRGRTINEEWVEHLKSWCSWRNEESGSSISKPEVVEYSLFESAPQQRVVVSSTPEPQPEKQEQHIVLKIKAPETYYEEYSNNDESREETQASVIKPVPKVKMGEQHIVPETQSPTISNDIYPEIITEEETSYIGIVDSDTSNNNETIIRKQHYAALIADTVRLLSQQQKLSQKKKIANGKIYDLQLGSDDVIKVMRKSGETIAEIPLDASKQPKGIALTEEDMSNFHGIQNAQFFLEASIALQQKPIKKRNEEVDEELG